MSSQIIDLKYNSSTDVSTITINLENLIANRTPVISKYSYHNEMPYEMVNRFIPQITEEVFEYQYELIHTTDSYSNMSCEAELELVDVILYLGSMLAEYTNNFGVKFDRELKLQYLNEGMKLTKGEAPGTLGTPLGERYVYAQSLLNLSDLAVDTTVEDFIDASYIKLNHVTYTLGCVRSIYPQRKYHKTLPYDSLLESYREDKIRNKDSFEYILRSILSCINAYILHRHADTVSGDNFLQDSTNSVRRLNELIIEKSDFNAIVSDK